MTAYPTWTPAARAGIVPLRPLTFGVILGRSFTALRQNPRVLLGFALVVQTLTTIVATAGIVAAGIFSFSRLGTVAPGSDDFETIMAGSIAFTGVVSIVLSLAAGALGVIVQGVVVTEVAHAVVAEKPTLGAVWRRVRPVAGRLIAYAVLLALVVVVVAGLVIAAVIALAFSSGVAAVLVAVLVVLATVPVSLWLTVKLLLVPAVIVMEHATVGGAIARSWRLTRGRFWSTLGIVVIISLAFGTLAQVAAIPLTIAASGLSSILAPTGDTAVDLVVSSLVASIPSQIVTLLIQSVATVVQSTATALVYVDGRMRHEGLDFDLQTYVDRRDAGIPDPPDPYRQHIGRSIGPRAWVAAPVPGAPLPRAPLPGVPVPAGSVVGAPLAAPPSDAPTPVWTPPAATEWTPPTGGAGRP